MVSVSKNIDWAYYSTPHQEFCNILYLWFRGFSLLAPAALARAVFIGARPRCDGG